jgi:hypothetical protein
VSGRVKIFGIRKSAHTSVLARNNAAASPSHAKKCPPLTVTTRDRSLFEQCEEALREEDSGIMGTQRERKTELIR